MARRDTESESESPKFERMPAHVGPSTDTGLAARSVSSITSHSGFPVHTRQPTDEDLLRERQNEIRRPHVRLATVAIDEAMFAALVRIDEALHYRKIAGDTQTLDRIDTVFSACLRELCP